jgi:hypothetical protein
LAASYAAALSCDDAGCAAKLHLQVTVLWECRASLCQCLMVCPLLQKTIKTRWHSQLMLAQRFWQSSALLCLHV